MRRKNEAAPTFCRYKAYIHLPSPRWHGNDIVPCEIRARGIRHLAGIANGLGFGKHGVQVAALGQKTRCGNGKKTWQNSLA